MAKFKCFPVSQEQRGLDNKDQTDHKVFVLRPEFASVEPSVCFACFRSSVYFPIFSRYNLLPFPPPEKMREERRKGSKIRVSTGRGVSSSAALLGSSKKTHLKPVDS